MKNLKIISVLFVAFFAISLIYLTATYAVNITANITNKTINIPINTGEKLLANENILHRLTNATVFEKPSSIYEFFDEDGKYNIISTSEETVYWSVLDSNMNITKTMSTPVIYDKSNADDKPYLKEITLTVGGYIYHQKYLYVIYTRIPSGYTDNALALVKYDKNFNEVARVEVPAGDIIGDTTSPMCGMYIPFYGSANCAIAINSSNILGVFFAKNRFDNHQDSALVFFDLDEMKWASNQKDDTVPKYVPYRLASAHSISHSFAQRMIPTTDGGFMLAELGDAGYRGVTRGIDITQIMIDRGERDITRNMFHCTENPNKNVTYNVVGNIVELSDGYLYVGGAEKTLGRDWGNAINESWNIFAQKYKKVDFEGKTAEELQMFDTEVRAPSGTPPEDDNGFTLYLTGQERDYGVKWLTNLENKTTTVMVRPIKIENDQVVIIWQEVALEESRYGGYQTIDSQEKAYYMIVDKDANILTPKTEIHNVGTLSYELDYMYRNGKIYWSTTSGGNSITIHTLDIKNPLPSDIVNTNTNTSKQNITSNTNAVTNKNNSVTNTNINTSKNNTVTNTNKNNTNTNIANNNNTVITNITFKDVKKTDWYYNAVEYVYKNNIIKGYNATTFAPNDKLSRGMLVTILYRMEGEPAVSGKPKFPDVQNSKDYYYKAVKWATDKKVVSGYTNGKFGPNDNITREDLAVILYRYAKYKGKNTSQTNDLTKFSDTKQISSYALPQIKWAVGAGVISGNANKTLNPKGTATRAEASAMLEKYCKKVGR
ncbi:MAG: S-layer homology domain-containing protein [Clostridia bacterium]|nr:S-layer homology domain-containing protein [Clostridia bacterium]